MMNDDRERLSSTRIHDIDDPVLDALDRAVVEGEGSGSPARALRDVPARVPVPDTPFDLEVAKPRAIAVERLYRLLKKEVPADIRAALGATVPVLLAHGMTPFYKAGQSPIGVWGMGYECRVANKKCDTVAVAPESRKYDVATVTQQMSFGIKAGGQIGAPAISTQALPSSPVTIDLAGASISATTDQQYAVALQCTFSILEVQAGPVDAGGARWNMYRGRDRIDTFQPLFQTMLVPKRTTKLRFEIKTWIRGSRRLLGLQRGREWIYEPKQFDVSLER